MHSGVLSAAVALERELRSGHERRLEAEKNGVLLERTRGKKHGPKLKPAIFGGFMLVFGGFFYVSSEERTFFFVVIVFLEG